MAEDMELHFAFPPLKIQTRAIKRIHSFPSCTRDQLERGTGQSSQGVLEQNYSEMLQTNSSGLLPSAPGRFPRRGDTTQGIRGSTHCAFYSSPSTSIPGRAASAAPATL